MIPITPEANAEVKRNLLVVLGSLAAFVLLVVGALMLLIAPSAPPVALRVGSLLTFAFSLPMIAIVGTSFTLAYGLDCWPAFMRGRVLERLYGIKLEEVSNKGMRRWMKSAGFWRAFSKGLLVAMAFVIPWLVAATAMKKGAIPDGLVMPAALVVVFAGGLAAKAWVIERLVVERNEISHV